MKGKYIHIELKNKKVKALEWEIEIHSKYDPDS